MVVDCLLAHDTHNFAQCSRKKCCSAENMQRKPKEKLKTQSVVSATNLHLQAQVASLAKTVLVSDMCTAWCVFELSVQTQPYM